MLFIAMSNRKSDWSRSTRS